MTHFLRVLSRGAVCRGRRISPWPQPNAHNISRDGQAAAPVTMAPVMQPATPVALPAKIVQHLDRIEA
jgi:hypothetical protein